MSEAQRIASALRGVWHGGYGLCFCPAHHNTKTPALSVSDGNNGRLLLCCHAGCGFTDILDALKGLGLIEGQGHYSPPYPADLASSRETEETRAKKQEVRALTCWNETVPIYGTIAEAYLRNRGITCKLPDTLRFHLNCWHPTGERLPAMIARVEGGPCFAIHRTYLRSDGKGKAAIQPAKAMLGSVSGGASRLSLSDGRLVVCEGVETGLSLLCGFLRGSGSVWAALSTSGMKNLVLPDVPGLLTIATDGDEAGRNAGNILGMRATALGWKVSLLLAPEGHDWNDVLAAKGRAVA